MGAEKNSPLLDRTRRRKDHLRQVRVESRQGWSKRHLTSTTTTSVWRFLTTLRRQRRSSWTVRFSKRRRWSRRFQTMTTTTCRWWSRRRRSMSRSPTRRRRFPTLLSTLVDGLERPAQLLLPSSMFRLQDRNKARSEEALTWGLDLPSLQCNLGWGYLVFVVLACH